jgi:hypothetical protein
LYQRDKFAQIRQGYAGYASVNPVVGETSDGFLSNILAQHIGLEQGAFFMAVGVTL